MDFVYTTFTPWLLVKERKDLTVGSEIILPQGSKSPYPFVIVEVEKGYETKRSDDKQCPFQIGDLLVIEADKICPANICGVHYEMVTENAVQGKVSEVGVDRAVTIEEIVEKRIGVIPVGCKYSPNNPVLDIVGLVLVKHQIIRIRSTQELCRVLSANPPIYTVTRGWGDSQAQEIEGGDYVDLVGDSNA